MSTLPPPIPDEDGIEVDLSGMQQYVRGILVRRAALSILTLFVGAFLAMVALAIGHSQDPSVPALGFAAIFWIALAIKAITVTAPLVWLPSPPRGE